MSERGTPRDTTIEEPALEAEHDDALTTGDEGLDDAVDPDAGDGEDAEGDEAGGTETGEVEDDAGIDGDGRRAAPVREPSRAQRRVETATRIASQAKAEAEAARRELAELRAAQQGRQTQEQQQLERERVALMSPEERTEFRLEQLEKRLAQERQQDRFIAQDAQDRVTFRAMCAENPAYKAVAGDVEAQLEEARRVGSNLPRETIATYLIGKRAIERANRAAPKQKREGAARVQRETVRAPGGGNNVRAGTARTSDAAARAKRLENMDI